MKNPILALVLLLPFSASAGDLSSEFRGQVEDSLDRPDRSIDEAGAVSCWPSSCGLDDQGGRREQDTAWGGCFNDTPCVSVGPSFQTREEGTNAWAAPDETTVSIGAQVWDEGTGARADVGSISIGSSSTD